MNGETVKKIYSDYLNSKPIYASYVKKLEGLIITLLEENKLKVHSIDSRVKTEDSFYKKINDKKDKYSCLEDVTDIAGIRIITYYADDVDKIAKVIEEEFDIDWENSIDKRKMLDPDRFGYLSLHYIIKLKNPRSTLTEYKPFQQCKAEVQIRSILQHAWAEIEHDSGYKNENDVPKDIKRDFYRLAGLLELGDKEFCNIREKLSEYKEYLVDEINKSPDTISLDLVSLNSYIENSELLKEVNREIGKVCGAEIIENKSSYSGTIKELNYVGINTIKDIEDKLVENKKLCIEFAKKMLKGSKYDTLYTTIGIFYLCYVIIARDNNVDKVYDYLTDNGIADDREAAAEKIISIYNSIVN